MKHPKKTRKLKRTTINERQSACMYEWWLALIQLERAHVDCVDCRDTAKKLKRFLGKGAIRLEKIVKEHPYKPLT